MEAQKSSNLAEVEITYKRGVSVLESPYIKSSADVYSLLKGIYNDDKVDHVEEAVLIMLATNNRVLGWAKLSQGGITGTVVDVRVIFQYALKANATSIILSHNHPSGGLVPSEQDKVLTRKVKAAGLLLDIRLLEHIIYTRDGYYSFADDAEI